MISRTNIPSFLFALNKPKGLTSHDCVDLARRALHTKKIGHGGTLDPFATGVLLLGVNSATKLLGSISKSSKTYTATITFGEQRNTDDIDGEVTQEAPLPDMLKNKEAARKALSHFVGHISQVPPAFSAISKGGVRAYKAAREGHALALEAREVEVFSAELVEITEEDSSLSWVVSFDVSSGCYIRALARDIGRFCKSAAYVSALERTSVSGVALSEAILAKDLPRAFDFALDPLYTIGLRGYELSDSEFKDVLVGRPFKPREKMSENVGVVYESDLYGIWAPLGSNLQCKQNFSQPIAGCCV